MQEKLKLVVMSLCCSTMAFAQVTETEEQKTSSLSESAFTFTEAQLGEDDDMSQNVTILNSNTNVYASQVGYQFSPVRFRYRAYNQKYNEVFVNGAPMNDMERGQFSYSMVGGLNQQTRNVDFALPFEGNSFTMPAMGGSNNYNFRAGSMAAGHRITLSGANRNYTVRGMYTYASGFNEKGWAIAANLTYRWAKEGYVEGTFYNALSYFLGVQKKWDNGHSLSLSTWGNPTERASQGASTDEAYWLANDRYYNPYWGYQNGHKRNSRVVNDFAPSAIATWDWNINNDMKLTTSLFGKYSMYKSTKLNYNNAENPQPNYWKNLPSSYYDVWDETNATYRTELALNDWNTARDFWLASKENRQINWDRLYWSNKNAAATGADALYYVQAKHSDNLTFNLSSTFTERMGDKKTWNIGGNIASNVGRHYQTMEDMLGASTFHNINSYALGTYDIINPYVQYDLNTMGANGQGKLVYEGDKFGYDYALRVYKGNIWSSYSATSGPWHAMIAGRMGQTAMNRKGYMRNGMFADNSYGASETAWFSEAGGKGSLSLDAGRGHVFKLGVGYEWKAPLANAAFVSPEMNNDFVSNLKDEHVFSSEFSYQYQNAWVHANLNAYYSRVDHATEWQNFYFDDINSFSYVSMTGIEKEYYGVELGLDFKVNSAFNIKALGTWGEAKNINNANVRYMSSTKRTYTDDIVMNKGMREAGTPLTAASLIASYHSGGWFIDLSGNYYDRIYLSYSPSYRYQGTLTTMGSIDNFGDFIVPEQAKGHGGFMLDGSIGRNIRLRHGNISINLMVTNILNNRNIVTGGYEQSRSDYTVKDDGSGNTVRNNSRTYKFSKNPMKYYAYGTNGMLNIAYKF
ncbi:MAG: TonB-dependent receptor [Prevotella sp.]|nr:TonB-dependent receptor [Prevotella sp.]MBQ6210378.1 TonB-dependent receptor [Prevotella sp.]